MRPNGQPVLTLSQIEYGSSQYLAARELRQDVLRSPLGLELGPEDLKEEQSQLHFGLFDAEGRLLACVIAVCQPGAKAKIRQTAVDPGYRRQGLASTMMRQLEEFLAARGIDSVTLHARRSAIGFYRKLGYETVGREFTEVTLPHRKMVKRIA